MDALQRWGIEISQGQRRLLGMHYRAMIEANRAMNLTRITEPQDAAVKHYADSLALLPWTEQRAIDVATVLDIGSGAGFPAVPLAVMRPAWKVTAIDSTGKKASFLSRCAAEMHLANLQVEHAHSAHWRPAAQFQLVVLRAVGRLADALTQASRHLAPDGWIAAYKTAELDPEELKTAASRARELRLRLREIFPYDLELRGEVLRRALHVFQRARANRKPSAGRHKRRP